jgi:hypothetical protein
MRSGADGSLLSDVRPPFPPSGWGYAVLGGVDVDGNGVSEVIVTQVNHNGPRTSRVFVHRRDGSVLYVIESPPGFQYGTALAKAGDIDRDGADDFLMASPEITTHGAAILVSGREGRILHIGYGELPGDRLDYSVAACGDIDRDGVPDFAGGGNWGARGVARAFSGRTGQPLHSWTGPYPSLWFPGAYFGASLGGGMDVDGDGVPDLVTTTNGEIRNGRTYDTLYAMSGRDGRFLLEYYVDAVYFVAPVFVDVSGPTGFARVAVRMQRLPNESVNGRIEALDLTPLGADVHGQGCTQGAADVEPLRLGLSRDTSRYTRIMASDVAPSAACVLLLGTSSTMWRGQSLPLQLGSYGWPTCALSTSIDAMVTTSSGLGRYRGLAVVDVPWPLGAASQLPLHVQWLCFERGGVRMTEAARLLLRY